MPVIGVPPEAGDHQRVHPIAQAAASTSATTNAVGPAVLVVLIIIAIWWLSTHGKGEVKLRLLAWLLLPVIVLGLVSARSPAEGGRIGSAAASGVALDISVVSRIVSGN